MPAVNLVSSPANTNGIEDDEEEMDTAESETVNKDHKKEVILYRPPQHYLDIFWLLSDGKDENMRNAGAMKLSQLLASSEEKEKSELIEYCRDRLIKGLSSGRMFARVGFSVALTQLLRENESLTNNAVMQAIKLKLRTQGDNSKSERGGIYLGKAFAFSSLIQSGRITKFSNDDVRSIVEELLIFGQKKSYMIPICFSIIESLLKQISVDTFAESVWSRINDPLKEGWQNCTLDKLSLLLACRETFPEVVKKKWLTKHWGFPILSEENDGNLLKVILSTETQKTEILLKRILPIQLKLNRTLLSIWNGVGDPLMNKESVKKAETLLQRQIIGLKFGQALLGSSSDKDQIVQLLLSPSLASKVFHFIPSSTDPLGIEGNALFDILQQKVKEENLKLQELVVKLWSLAERLSEGESAARDIINSNNFVRLVNLMDAADSAMFAETLIDAVNGTSDLIELSENSAARERQVESCLRCLQLIVFKVDSSQQLHKSVLNLFVRLGFFKIIKKNKEIQHCNTTVNLEPNKPVHKVCKSLFFKSLNQLFAMGGFQKKTQKLDSCLTLLYEVAKYFQSLMKRKNISPLESWPEELGQQWDAAVSAAGKLEEISPDLRSSTDKAFLLLILFLSFKMLTDFKTYSELLEEVHLCHKNARKPKVDLEGDEGEPAWQEVLTEVLLNLMSLQCHFGRLVASTTLSVLTPQLTLPAVRLITDVLIPKSGKDDDAGGVLVESKDGDEEDSEDDDSLIDEDIADVESDGGSDESDDAAESEEDEGEEVEVDEGFRASVQEALGEAAVKENGVGGGSGEESEEELSDLSDSEMFKLDDMLAEVFRQKAKTSKKGKMEKKKELHTFRIRVLDLMEVLVLSDKCGDFVLELVEPLLLSMRDDSAENREMVAKSKSILRQLKKSKGLVDSLHSSDEQIEYLKNLLELSHNIADTSKVADISLACHVVMKLNYPKEKETDKKCDEIIETTLQHMLSKGTGKLHPSFFTQLIEYNAERYQFLFPTLASCLKDPTVKLHGKMTCCLLLCDLVKKIEKDVSDKKTVQHLQEVAGIVSEVIRTFLKGESMYKFTVRLLNLALAIEDRCKEPFFGDDELKKLTEMNFKAKDLKKLTRKFAATIKRKTTPTTEVAATANTKGKKNISKTEGEGKKSVEKKKKRRQSDKGAEHELPSSKQAKH